MNSINVIGKMFQKLKTKPHLFKIKIGSVFSVSVSAVLEHLSHFLVKYTILILNEVKLRVSVFEARECFANSECAHGQWECYV